MTPREVNVFLTRAALLDPRMKRTDPAEQRDMAVAWADLLDDVGLDAALKVLREHYRGSSDAITPAVIVAGVGASLAGYLYESIDEQLEREARTRALAAAGVTEAEFAAHEGDVVWIRAKFAPHQLTEGPGA